MNIQNIFDKSSPIAIFLLLTALVTTIKGQTPTPAGDTIRVSTDLIQTNITVVDKNNQFVDGLKQEEFELRVDGKTVPISFFDRIAVGNNETLPKPANSSKISAATANPSLLNERKIIFFVDDLHLSPDSLKRTHSAITHFINDEMMPHDNVLIVSASGQIGFLQQFTDNKAVLRAALARLKFIPFTTRDTEPPPMPEFTALRILNGDKAVADFYVEEIFKGFNVKNLRGINYNGALEMVRNRANNIVSALVSVSETSLGSLDSLLQVLNQTDGRKLVFFASDGFFLGSKNNSPVDNVRLQRVVDAATRSGSIIYTIDARGLFSLQADATGDRPYDPKGRFDSGNLSEVAQSQDALFTLAEQTGGKFLKNQNYFDKWIDRTLAENSSYYVLAWSPEKEGQTDKNYKRIEVIVVGRPDLTVRLPRGYLTHIERNDAKNSKGSRGKENSNNKISPIAEDIPAQQTSAKKLLPTILLLNYLDVPNIGGVLTSSVQIAVGALDYSVKNKPATIDLAGIILNEQGKQVADFKTGLNITPDAQNTSAQNGQSIIYNNRTPLAPGIYQVRVGARDSRTGQTGTATKWIQIPDLTKKELILGSIFLGVKEIKKSDKPEDIQVQFSVNNQFSRPLQLDFMSFVYNAARTTNGEVNLATKIEIFDAQGRTIVNTPMRPLSTKGLADLSHIPLTGAVKQQTSAFGTYLLRVTVNDLVTNATAVEQIIFTVE